MVDDSLLLREFYSSGFRSYYSCNLIAKENNYTFFGGEKEFETIRERIKNSADGRYCYPCFGKFQEAVRQLKNNSITDSCLIPEDIILYILINTNKKEYTYYRQYCWMTVEELINHINIVKSLFDGFEFSVIKDPINENFMRIKFLFEKEKITLFKIRFLLTWMRYSYEWSISMATLDAYRLLNNREYIPELSKENIFNLVEITDKLVYPYILTDQVICHKGTPMEFDLFKKNVNKKENNSLNYDIYNHRVDNLGNYIHFSSDSDDDGRDKTTPPIKFQSIAWWEDIDEFENVRLPLYKQILETLKKQDNYEPAKEWR